MTGINASKIIQNLQFLNNFASMFTDVCCQSRQRALLCFERRSKRERLNRGNLMSIAGFFSFFQIGSGPYPPTPRNRGAGCQLESLPSSQWDPESRLGTCPSPSGASPGSIPGDRLNLSDFLSAMRTNSRIWDPIGLNDPIARPQPLEMLICNSAIGNSNWGNWDPQVQFGQLANWQFNQIQFPRFNEGNSLIDSPHR